MNIETPDGKKEFITIKSDVYKTDRKITVFLPPYYEEYKNEKYSSYEMLESWVNDNKDFIREQHSLFIGETIDRDTTRMLDGGMYVIDLGYRNKQPVALIEKTMQDNSKEYIIAFNYKITDKKIDWAYGYYYNENISKAKQDFNKVLSGGNLANTFDKNKKDKER